MYFLAQVEQVYLYVYLVKKAKRKSEGRHNFYKGFLADNEKNY